MVVDASVMIAWLMNEPHFALPDDIAQLLAEQTLNVPAHWPAEIANALTVNLRRRRLGSDELEQIDRRICMLHVVVEPAPSIDGIRPLVQFAADHGLTAYDAAYVLLAHQCGDVLATVDEAMRSVARQLNIGLLPA